MHIEQECPEGGNGVVFKMKNIIIAFSGGFMGVFGGCLENPNSE